ncbi:hypothetical protein BJ508DRAFT_306928 [Ascobolus immersus RN42]|uniref:F-box domain-containing protein n=1 Tax=Ascobolus immersus RN42 TaxID=1160509 RepID=A0A3N4I4J5_ASCIM|nr:hypothetical protein BJ508DRAFT_306928 [Ascobolus immersus RN42]
MPQSITKPSDKEHSNFSSLFFHLPPSTILSNHTSQQRPDPPPETFDFLGLPAELRLELYRHLSAFTLLQLSHTCHDLRREILGNQVGIINKALGYVNPPGLTMHNISRVDGLLERCLIRKLYWPPFAKPRVWRGLSEGGYEKKWWCCVNCQTVKVARPPWDTCIMRMENADVFGKIWRHGCCGPCPKYD